VFQGSENRLRRRHALVLLAPIVSAVAAERTAKKFPSARPRA